MSRAAVALLVICGCERAPSPYDRSQAKRPEVADASIERVATIAKGDAPTKLVVTPTAIVWVDEIAGRVMKLSTSDGELVVLAHDQAHPLDLAVDADRVYWTTQGPWVGNTDMTTDRASGGVWSVPLSGGEPTAIATHRAYADAIAVDDTYVYFAEQGPGVPGQLLRVSKTGGAVTRIHAGYARGIVVDGDRLYWTVGGSCASVNGAPMPDDGSIWSSPRGKLAPKQIASKLRCPEEITVDRDSIYVANMDDGQVLRIPKRGGTPVVAVTDDSHGVRYVAIDATTIYWANQFTGKVKRKLKRGGEIETLFDLKDPAGIRVDDQYVYVTDSELGVVRRIAK